MYIAFFTFVSTRAATRRVKWRNALSLKNIIASWHRMSEVYDAFPTEAAYMLVGPYDLVPVAEAHLTLAQSLNPKSLGAGRGPSSVHAHPTTFLLKALTPMLYRYTSR